MNQNNAATENLKISVQFESLITISSYDRFRFAAVLAINLLFLMRLFLQVTHPPQNAHATIQ